MDDLHTADAAVMMGTASALETRALASARPLESAFSGSPEVGRRDTVRHAERPSAWVADRQLASILFTDIVSSTAFVSTHGDAHWAELVKRHEEEVRSRVGQEGGHVVKMVGDGSMSVFTGPAAAIRAARSICEDAPGLDIEVRAGVHTGECDRLPSADLAGLAVHIAARVVSAAGPGEVWVSRTVRDLIGGSRIQLSSCGAYRLKGLRERWELFLVVGEDAAVKPIPQEPSPMRASNRVIVAGARHAARVLRGLNRIERLRRRRASLRWEGPRSRPCPRRSALARLRVVQASRSR